MTVRRAAVVVWAFTVAVACGSGGGDPGDATAATSTPTTATSTSTLVPSSSGTTPTTEAFEPPALPAGGLAWDHDFPDPFVLEVDGRYLAYGTTSGRIEVQRLDGPDLAAWSGPSEAVGELPGWAVAGSAWAPSVLAVDGEYVLYYTALVAMTDRHCIAAGVAEAPEGPFVPVGDEPLVCPHDQGGAIDPSPFVDHDGTAYLLWKNDGITLRRDSSIWSQELAADGRSLRGEPVELIGTDQRWEYPHIEAPSLARRGDGLWLAYSGNWWNQDAYGVGMARCESAIGPCTKPFDRPVLVSAPGREGPGGAELFRDGADRLLVVYHAWRDVVGFPGERRLWIEVVDETTDPPTIRPAVG